MVKLGDKMTFMPTAWSGNDGLGLSRDKAVTGEVDYIHRAHRWYRVRYELDTFCGRVVGYECFPLPPEGDQRADTLPRDGGNGFGVYKGSYVRREKLPEIWA